MTLIRFALCLFGGAILTLVAGYIIVVAGRRKYDFWESVSFMRSLIKSSELSKTAYQNILCAFREFDAISYRDEKVYKELISDFLFKYRDFLPEDKDEPKIKIIPDNSEGYHNYKVHLSN
jgi:hypothetical protein